MAGPVEMARLVSILAQRRNSVGLDGRARLSEQGQPSKSSSEFQTWLRQSCFEWALRRQEIPCPIEAGRIVVELPTGDRVERIGRLPGLIQRFVFPGGFLPSKTSYATRKSGSEDRRSGEFRRGLCVDVAGVAKAFPREVAEGRTARLRRAVQSALGILPLLLGGRLPIRHDRCRTLFNSASSCLS